MNASTLKSLAIASALALGASLGAAPAMAQQQSSVLSQSEMSSTHYAAMSGAQSGLTRSDVKQDLARAERSGEIQRLNSTVYKGN